jgi:hypothetical protein
MRCARCDRPILPQAVGLTPDGRVAFGWCLRCLVEERCTHIGLARDLPPDTGIRIKFEPAAAHAVQVPLVLVSAEQIHRARAMNVLAGILGAWSMVLLGMCAYIVLNRPAPIPAQPASPGIGGPVLLGVGGCATAAAAMVLWMSSRRIEGRANFWQVWALRMACWAGLVLVAGRAVARERISIGWLVLFGGLAALHAFIWPVRARRAAVSPPASARRGPRSR